MSNNPTPPPPGRGRPPGAVNKATANARAAIADFVDGNVERLNGWLDAIANGEKKTEVILVGDKEEIRETHEWARRPDPLAAFNAYMSVIEYHIPKLARIDSTVDASVKHEINWPLAKSKLDE